MTTERIQIVVSSSGAVTVKKDIESVGKSAQKSSAGINMLKGALTALISMQTISTLVSLSDTFVGIENRLKLVTSSTEELRDKTQELLEIANTSRNSFEAVATLYQRTQQAVDAYGISSERTTNFVDLLSKATTLSGASSIEAENAIRQLTQGLASGELRGEEFRSVAEQLPYVLGVLSESLGITTGELRDMAYDGQLTPQLIIAAFEKMSASINEDFAQTVPTVAQAMTNLRNNVTALVGDINNSTGAFSILAQGILWVANNLDTVLLALTPVMVGLTALAVSVIGSLVLSGFAAFGAMLTTTVSGLSALVTGVGYLASAFTAVLIPAITRLTVAVMANPLIAAASLTALGVAWITFGDHITAVGTKIVQTASELAGLDKFGEFLGGTFTIDLTGRAMADAIAGSGKSAATAMDTAIKAGGKSAAEMLKNGVKEGGKDAADALKNAGKNSAGDISKSGEKMTKDLEKAGKTSGDKMKDQVITGGEIAASQMENSIRSGGQAAASVIAGEIGGAIQAMVQVLNDYELATRAAQAYINDLEAQAFKNDAEGVKAGAEARKANEEAQAIRRDSIRGGSGGSGTSRGGGGGFMASSGFTGFNEKSYQPSEPVVTQSSAPVNLNVTNIVDPRAAAVAMDTAEGHNSMMNFIRLNSDEVKSALGVV